MVGILLIDTKLSCVELAVSLFLIGCLSIE